MKNLIEVAKIVTKKKVRKIEIFDDATLRNKSSKFNEFYEALMNSRFKNDRDAASFLYNCSPTDDKYRQLKSRFRKRLLNTLFFLDINQPSVSGYDRAYYSCNKDWTLVKILFENNAPNTGTEIARSIYLTAEKYKFADIIMNSSRVLREQAAIDGNLEEFEEYDKQIKQYGNVYEAEIRSEEFLQRVKMQFHQQQGDTTHFEERIEYYCNALVSLSEQYDSPVVLYNMFLVWIYRYEVLRDFDAMVEVCKRAEEYIAAHPIYQRDEVTATFRLKKMTAYLHLKDYKNGMAEAERGLKIVNEASPYFFDYLELYFLLAMHTDNYIKAMAIHNHATAIPKFKRLPSADKEKWQVFEMYLDLMLEYHDIENPTLIGGRKKMLRNTKFINEPILFPKEQRMYTVHYMIGQFLYHLRKGAHALTTETADKMKSFSNRQLKPEEYLRAINFFKLLQSLPKAEYKLSEITSTEKYYNRLVDQPFNYRGMLNELEVVPFEKLWNIILSKIK
jgi:hypothetical protein